MKVNKQKVTGLFSSAPVRWGLGIVILLFALSMAKNWLVKSIPGLANLLSGFKNVPQPNKDGTPPANAPAPDFTPSKSGFMSNADWDGDCAKLNTLFCAHYWMESQRYSDMMGILQNYVDAGALDAIYNAYKVRNYTPTGLLNVFSPTQYLNLINTIQAVFGGETITDLQNDQPQVYDILNKIAAAVGQTLS